MMCLYDVCLFEHVTHSRSDAHTKTRRMCVRCRNLRGLRRDICVLCLCVVYDVHVCMHITRTHMIRTPSLDVEVFESEKGVFKNVLDDHVIGTW